MKTGIFLFVLLAVATPTLVFAAINLNLDYPEFGNITLDKDECEKIKAGTLTGKVCGQNLNIVAWVYYLILGISGLAAFLMLVWGGIQWLTSGAIPSQASEARDKLKSAILGLLLILASFLIIQVLNPELTVIQQDGLSEALGINPKLDRTAVPSSGSGLTTPDPAVLTANGEKDITLSFPASTVTLRWSLPKGTCTVSSTPSGLWTGQRDLTGSESVNLSSITNDPTLIRFSIVCEGGLAGSAEASVLVNVASDSTADPLPKITQFEIKHKNASDWFSVADSPLTCCKSGDDISPDDQIQIRWDSINATSCFGQDHLVFSGTLPFGKIDNLMPVGDNDYRYTLVCSNSTGQSTDPQTIIIKRRSF